MFGTFKNKAFLGALRTITCTVAASLALGSTWRVPREAFKFGALAYLLAHTFATVVVALPVILLHLAVGQLCQQDTLGMWRAVPFFKGIGFLRLLISFVGLVLNFIYMSLIVIYFAHTITTSNHLYDCDEEQRREREKRDWVAVDETNYVYNETQCLNSTLESITDEPEYFVAMALMIAVMWITAPILLYNPVRVIRRIFYGIAPVTLILAIIAIPNLGSREGIGTFVTQSDFRNFLHIDIWYSALIQALWSSQTAGGYLVSASDALYSKYNVQWTSLAVTGTCVVFSWLGCLFWVGIGGADDTSVIAVLVHTHSLAGHQPNVKWLLIAYIVLFLSGIMNSLTLLLPLYECFRHASGGRWRVLCAVCSLLGGACALAVLAGSLPALELIEDVTIPLLIAVATLLETIAFIFVYGWKTLVEDIEFLSGCKLGKCWVLGWCGVPGVLAPFMVWWVVVMYLRAEPDQPWHALTLSVSAALLLVIMVVMTAVAVATQVQYDFCAKLQSSFKPSRHWGPRDPITHYYWLARREEADRRHLPCTVYRRPRPGQFAGRISYINVPNPITNIQTSSSTKKRANSDDLLYTGYRKQCLQDHKGNSDDKQKQRSVSHTGR